MIILATRDQVSRMKTVYSQPTP